MTRRDRYGERLDEDAGGEDEQSVHDQRCRSGWLGEDDAGHPIPCPTCRPWLVACPACGTSRASCETNRHLSGWGCCPACPHRPHKATRRTR